MNDRAPSSASGKRLAVMLLIVIISLVLGVWANQLFLIQRNDTRIPPHLDITVLPKARPLVVFKLQDHNGGIFGPEQLKNHWSFLFFGFTHCPDVCPTTLKVMQQVWQKLPDEEGDVSRPKLYFISVDPDRDDLKTLKQYVTYFNPDFIGVTGALDEIDKLTNQIGILYGYDEKDNNQDDDYIVNHSAQLILIDPKGRMRAVISPPHETENIFANFQKIRLFYGD